MYEFSWHDQAKDDMAYWLKHNDIAILKRIKELLNDIRVNPFEGTGKPEPLKKNLQGYWSRRITQ